MLHRDAPPAVPPYSMLFAAVMGSGLAYFTAFHLNFFLFDWLEFSEGVNWVFLPSGLRLLLVLVLGAPGALGIALGSCLINYQLHGGDASLFNIVTAAISGGAPLLARGVCMDLLKMETNLEGLTAQSLLKISTVFAAFSAVLHQVWYFWVGYSTTFVASAGAMAIGDLLGTALLLTVTSWTLRFAKSNRAS